MFVLESSNINKEKKSSSRKQRRSGGEDTENIKVNIKVNIKRSRKYQVWVFHTSLINTARSPLLSDACDSSHERR